MRSVALLTILLLCATVLAGCSGGSDSTGSASGAGTASGTGSSSQGSKSSSSAKGSTSQASGSPASSSGSGTGGPANRPPSAILTAGPVTGTAPLTVQFNLTGSDPDGDAIAWQLDSDGNGKADTNGTTLPKQVSHTFNAAGRFVINFTVSDGKLTAKTNATVVVGVTPPAGPTQIVDADYTVAVEGCPSNVYDLAKKDPVLAAGQGAAANGKTRVQAPVTQSTAGKTYTATWTFDTGQLSVGVSFYKTNGDLVQAGSDPMSAAFDGITKTGTVPSGADVVVMFACGGPSQAHVHYEA